MKTFPIFHFKKEKYSQKYGTYPNIFHKLFYCEYNLAITKHLEFQKYLPFVSQNHLRGNEIDIIFSNRRSVKIQMRFQEDFGHNL